MFIGKTLCAENSKDSGDEYNVTANPSTVYTPWIPSEGDVGIFTAEIIALSRQDDQNSTSLPQLTMTVETKKSEDTSVTTKGSDTATNNSSGVTDFLSVEVSECKELVRCKYVLTDTATSQNIVERCYYAVFRCLNVSWSSN